MGLFRLIGYVVVLAFAFGAARAPGPPWYITAAIVAAIAALDWRGVVTVYEAVLDFPDRLRDRWDDVAHFLRRLMGRAW
jgi:hypothetical protein